MGKRIQQVLLKDLASKTLRLGYVGENEHTQIIIDCTEVLFDYPAATATMVVQPPVGAIYPVVLTRDENKIIWEITGSDVMYAGGGRLQLTFTNNGEIVKSAIGATSISSSIEATGEAPSPVETWVDAANEKLAEVDEALADLNGIPSGGSSGQVLAKASGTDYDAEWVNQSGGTSDYSDLTNKPSINSVPLSGNKSLSDLGAASAADVSAKYTKPSGGIPKTDLASAVQTSLSKADTAYQKPSGGIPSTDLASDVIPTVHNVPSGGTTGQALVKASNTDYDAEWSTIEVSAAQIESAVDDWLDENITNPSSPPLDRSLSLSNAAAPADLVGDLNSAINDYIEFASADFESGYMNSDGTDAADTSANASIRSKYCDALYKRITINLSFSESHSMWIGLCVYDANKQAVSFSDGTTRKTYSITSNEAVVTFEIPDNAIFYRFSFRSFNETYSLTVEGLYNVNSVYNFLKSDEEGINNRIDSIIDASSYISGFSSVQAANATYYNNGVREFGSATTRLINITTLSYPFDVKISAKYGYSFTGYVLGNAYTFTKSQNAPYVRKSNDWVESFVFNAKENILLVVRKGDGNPSISTTEWDDALEIIEYPYSQKSLTTEIERISEEIAIVSSDYALRGNPLNMAKQMMKFSLETITPTEATGKATQGIAIDNGVLFQGYGEGTIEMIDMSTGTIINSYKPDNTSHCGSLSFSDKYYANGDEFHLLYVASYNNPETAVYRINRESCTLIKKYVIPVSDAGYCQESAIDKDENIIWTIAHKNNSYESGGGLILSSWDIQNATDNGNGTFTPALNNKVEMHWIPYLQFIQPFNGLLFVGFGSDLNTEAGASKIIVFDKNGMVHSELSDVPSGMAVAEIEGCDMVLNENGTKYDIIWAQRDSVAYYRITL